MDSSHLLDNLNTYQYQAVTASPSQSVLVLAGAGSGKTRVLVHRIAWLLATEQARPYNILAVTFTNKAANEMQARINTLVTNSAQGLWVGTFHGIAHRLLRIHWQTAQLPQTFQILDSDDQERTIKRVIRSLQLDEKNWSPKQAQFFINARKDAGQRAKDILLETDDAWLKQMVRIYRTYEETCQNSGVVDFAELLLRAYELLRDNQELCEHYQRRFQHILVDEFQDTNTIQYEWLRLLAGHSSDSLPMQARLFVVGDDDQSIYSWRGARVENLEYFRRDFGDTLLIKLEQNYRSTGTILEVANVLIANNKQRLGKNLWTADKAGEPVYLYNAYNEVDEAEFVISKIKSYDYQLQEMAILYRTTAQSRLFEEALLKKNIPYRIYGGFRFYERAEIKDALAYLRLAFHPNDDGAFERIVNTPKRSIGEQTVESVRSFARQQGLSLWQAAQQLIETGQLKARASHTLAGFLALIEQIAIQITQLPLSACIKYINESSGLIQYYQKESKEDAQRRLENLDELVIAAKEFEKSGKDGIDPIMAFLAHTALESGEGQGSEFDDCVQLMSLHLAKGLEFKVVFLCGLEEGLFPHQNSLDESKLEEERRLCYVGITRAREYLYLCHSESRYRYGSRDFSRPSRFIREIPAELIEDVRFRKSTVQFVPTSLVNSSTTPTKRVTTCSAKSFVDAPFQIGEQVKHPTFGKGVVLSLEGEGELMRIQVRFTNDNKWLVLAYAKLEKLPSKVVK